MAKLQTASKFFGACVGKNVVAADLTSTDELFTVSGGPIRILELGFIVTTATPAGANTIKFTFTPTGGSSTDLSSTTDTASATAQQLFLMEGTKATVITKTTDVGILAAGQTLTMTNIIVSEGVIGVTYSGGPPASGAGQFFMRYEPLSSFTQVTVN